MSELEQEVVAGIEGLSGTTQESLINSVRGEERCFKQRRANLSHKGKIRCELHDRTIPHWSEGPVSHRSWWKSPWDFSVCRAFPSRSSLSTISCGRRVHCPGVCMLRRCVCIASEEGGTISEPSLPQKRCWGCSQQGAAFPTSTVYLQAHSEWSCLFFSSVHTCAVS